MNKKVIIILILVLVVVGGGLLVYLTSSKECKELNESQCKKDDRCLSVLVPCQGVDCTSDAMFKECKSKEAE